MPPAVASAIFGIVIVTLFWLDRDEKVRTSIALWLPVIWVALACSRTVSQWMQSGPQVDSPQSVLDGDPVDRVIYMCFIVIGLIVLSARGKRVLRFLLANGPILFFFFFCLVSLLWSDYPDVAFKRWVKAIGDLVMVLIVLSDPEPAVAFKRLLTRVGYILVPLSILFIKYYENIGTGYGPWGGPTIATGVTTNKNTLGMICLIFGLGALWRLIVDFKNKETLGRARHLTAHCMFLCMIFWLFWVSNSMTSLNSFLMAGILLIVANSRLAIRKPIVVHLVALTMLVVSASVVFLDIIPQVLVAMGRNPTLTDRTEVWGILRSLVDNPYLGTGLESFWLGPRLEKMWSIYWWHPNEAHNGYLEIFLQLGWIGIGLLAVVILTGYRTSVRAWRRDPPTGSIWLAFFYVGLVFNFTEAAFFKMLAPVWIFFLFATVSAPVLKVEAVEASEPQHSNQLVAGQAHPALSQKTV